MFARDSGFPVRENRRLAPQFQTPLSFDNSGYRFPANVLANCTQEFLNDKACGIVDYTFNQLMAVNQKTIDDVRSAGFLCNVYVYAEGDNIYAYCFYA